MEASRLKVDRITTSDKITGSSLQTRVDLAPHHVVSQTESSQRWLSFLFHIILSSGGQFCKISFRWKLCGSSAPTSRQSKRVHWNKLSLLWITPVFFLLRHHSLLCHVIPNHLGKECKFPSSETPFWRAGLEHVSITGRLLWEMFVSGSLFYIILHIWHDIQLL